MEHVTLDVFARRAKGFFHNRVKSVRMVVTRATEIELLAEELTSNEEEEEPPPAGLAKLASAAVSRSEENKILSVLQQRFEHGGKGGGKNWRMLHRALVTAEYLLTHGPRHFAAPFAERCGAAVEEHSHFKHVDDGGIDRGAGIRDKARRVCGLLRDGELLDRERRAAKCLGTEAAADAGAIPINSKPRAFGPSRSAAAMDYDPDDVSSSYYAEPHSPMYSDWREEAIEDLKRACGKEPAGKKKGAGAFGAARSQTFPAAPAAAAAAVGRADLLGAQRPREELPRCRLGPLSGPAPPGSGGGFVGLPAAAAPAPSKDWSPSADTPTSVLPDPTREWQTFDEPSPQERSPTPFDSRDGCDDGAGLKAALSPRAKDNAGSIAPLISGLRINLGSPIASDRAAQATTPASGPSPPAAHAHVSPLVSSRGAPCCMLSSQCAAPARSMANEMPDLIDF